MIVLESSHVQSVEQTFRDVATHEASDDFHCRVSHCFEAYLRETRSCVAGQPRSMASTYAATSSESSVSSF